MPKHPNNYI